MSKLTRAVVYFDDRRIVTFQSDNIHELEGWLKEQKGIRSLAITETMTKEEYEYFKQSKRSYVEK